jgi:hypothetical protein
VYPAKLQPEIVERYFQNSLVRHQFLAITEGDPITGDVGHLLSKSALSAPDYCPDDTEILSPEVIDKVEVSSIDNAI